MAEVILVVSVIAAFAASYAIFRTALDRDRVGFGVIIATVVTAFAVVLAGAAIAWLVDPPRSAAVGPMSKGTETR